MLGLEVLFASAFSASAVFFEREHAVPLVLYVAFFPAALISTCVGASAYRETKNPWLLLYPAASITLIPCVWLFAIYNFFRFIPE
jgi:hypothetical protein